MAEFDSQDHNLRVIDGITLERVDPFGFWRATSGPKELTSQVFTDTHSAYAAVKAYNHLARQKAVKPKRVEI